VRCLNSAILCETMRQIEGPTPNLFRSTVRWHGIGSKDWVPTGRVQRVGAFVIGLIYVVGAAACIASTVFFKGELTGELHSEAAAFVVSFLLVSLVLVGGGLVIALGIRLLKGSLRTSRKRG
jgi:VIT1/CCC1 family predicted Fe2+/Mn2+ transporter